MFQNIDYNNFPFIIASGVDFIYELNAIKNEILPIVKSHYFHKKHFSVNFFDLIYPNKKPMEIQPNLLNDFVLLNLDSITQNGSICICLLGEDFEREQKTYSKNGCDFNECLQHSLQISADSGYPWIYNLNEDDQSSMLEVLSFYAGLLSEIKYPLFYFRVSGGPISDDDQNEIVNSRTDNENSQMEKLKQKLIRNGLPIKFYGSALEFKEAIKTDLDNIFEKFPDKSTDQDAMFIDQQCFANDRLKIFPINENIKNIFTKFDCLYTILSKWTPDKINSNPDKRIDQLLDDFYRKEFSDKLAGTSQRLHEKNSSLISICEDNKILVLTGSRGSGKSSILVNWLQSKTKNTGVLCIPYYCEASYVSSDLRKMLHSFIKRIRSHCGYNLEQDDYEMHSLETEMLFLSQQFLGSILLAKQLGYRLLIIIDGIDHLGDKCAFSTKQIKCTDWIPEVLPDNVRIIITSTASDSSLTQLKSKRTDMAIVEILPESIDDQENLIKSGIAGLKTLIGKYGQTYPANFPQLIYAWPLISNPLIQRILAQVYHTLGTSTKWKSFIEKVAECQTLVELVRRVLKLYIYHLNWELAKKSDKMKKKYGTNKDEDLEDRSIQGWVPDCLSLLVLSRNGLTLNIILSCLEKLGYVKDFEVFESDIWSLFHFTRDIILKFHNEKFKFTHSICKEIIEHAFLAIATCSSVEARTRECQDSMYVDKRCKFHLLLAYHFWNQRNYHLDNFSECIYHLDRASDYQSMEKVLFLPRVLLGMFGLDIRQMTSWHGQLVNTHFFQYCMHILSSRGCDFVENVRELLNKFCDLEIEAEVGVEVYENVQKIVKSNHPKNTSYQSDFTQRFKICIDNEEEKESWLTVEESQRNKFLLFLGRLCILMDRKSLARKIFNYLENNLNDKVLMCSILWFDISLDCSFQTVLRNEDYIHSALIRLEDLTSDLLKDDWLSDSTENDTLKYLRCMCLLLKCSINSERQNERYFPSEYHELMILTESFNSVILDSLIKEMNFNSMEETKDLQVIQDKIFILSNIIILFETWTGPVHSHMARLFVKLSRLFGHGNSQLRFKAEACCRRALWIWKFMNKNRSNHYNSEENECREILFQLLIKDPCKSSIFEAKNQIYLTFDNRMKYLGCYHPLTINTVPYIKFIDNLSERSKDLLQPDSKILVSKSSKNSVAGSLSFPRNQLNFKINKLERVNTSDRFSAGFNKRSSNRRIESYNSSLQFINRYSSSADGFSEEIDWNEIAHNSPRSSMGRFSASRIQSAYMNNHSSISFNLSSTPIRSQSASMSNSIPKHIYFGIDSSLRSLCRPNSESHNKSVNESRNGKQVRFINLTKSKKNKFIQTEMAKMIQQKVHNMKSFRDVININKYRSVSANFSRPYSNCVDPIF